MRAAGGRDPSLPGYVDGFLSDDAAFLNAGAAYLFNRANGQFKRAPPRHLARSP